jgi:leucyl-tRNA synthetase
VATGYDPQEIETRWQAAWEEQGLHRADDASGRPPYYALTMFPYPSGDLHMGHAEAFSLADAIARYQRLRGHEVLNPIGWDSFGLPAENAAISRGADPRGWTYDNIETQAATMRRMGLAFDWSRRLHTSDPEYYRWTQWLFLELYRAGWAYRQEAQVNWCPNDQTVLANEQVVDGACERCGAEVSKRALTQWFFRITEFAQRLLDDLDTLADTWPERVLALQRNWIGRSEGAEVRFRIDEADEDVTVYTTRPDTLHGATFFVVAPEHPRARAWAEAGGQAEAFDAFLIRTQRKTDRERQEEQAKDGVPLGVFAINPVNGERMPVYAADYVLMDYGTGAIMAVPGHDQRDLDFARAHDLPVKIVVAPADADLPDPATMTDAFAGEGAMVNTPGFDGMPWREAKQAVIATLAEDGLGEAAVNFRLRDWLVSRQRYWGAPIPIIHCPDCGEVPVPVADLPVVLPEASEVDFRPSGTSPLATSEAFLHVDCPSCGGAARRDTDTMDTFVDSSWYFLRYTAPGRDDIAFDRETVDRWLPVEQYTGGIEHAILHLLYARFITKALHDLDHVGFLEPFTRLKSQGMVLMDGAKMSKSLGNLVRPGAVVDKHGADTLRATMLFAGPIEDDIDWADVSPAGMSKWLGRLARVTDLHLATGDPTAASDSPAATALRRATHAAIKGCTEDYDGYKYNTAIAKLMTLTNETSAALREHGVSGDVVQEALEALQVMLSPICPHLAEELWHRLGHDDSVHRQDWPTHDPALLVEATKTVPVQVDGKVRDTVALPAGADQGAAEAAGRELANVARHLEGRAVVKVVWVPDRLLNFVTRPA